MFNKFFFLSLGGVAVAVTGTGLGVYYGIGNNSKSSDKPKDPAEREKPPGSLSEDRSIDSHQSTPAPVSHEQHQETPSVQAA